MTNDRDFISASIDPTPMPFSVEEESVKYTRQRKMCIEWLRIIFQYGWSDDQFQEMVREAKTSLVIDE